ncbi:hypothetical protein [Candidatus Nanosynbacter lyticus]|uniref:hypothetical protein n=1 Tax=Candidatus Nanosynbacter lyticus TaxID=2093824 RepID=UPI0025576804|nr:hypothetical protein [Candidatus Nanosynbacter lyticus]WLD46869.1 hypothetical protein NLML1_0498 [Candidatus Nanosynbacter lyticus]
MEKQRRPLPQSPEQEWLEDQQSQGEAGTDGTPREWREVVVQDLETAKRDSPGRKPPIKAVYSAGDMKVTVFDATPDHDVCMKISYKGKARNIRLQRSDPEGALLARFGPELGADMIRVIRHEPEVDRHDVSRRFFETVNAILSETE